MSRRAVIAGVGHSAFGKIPERSAWELEAEAVAKAVADAGLAPHEIDGLDC
ncbi:MAG: hypothetical protein JRG94_07055 [Deltaproteobacteria bacterium]|nr:hypothetical protein [Deltaproteobacteria bacterium]